MRLSQVLVVAAASFLFASEAITVTMDSNQAKISTVVGGGPSQRLLRRNEKPVDPDSDDSDDLDEERGGNTDQLKALARSWGLSFSGISQGTVRLSEDQLKAWQAIVNAGIKASKREKIAAYNAAWRRENGIGRRV
ncbi:Secreted RxLR effector peptide protein [Phytophthora palmivora]|uniref:RxLR effector protein n=1 Tax=Phytophthora palmivora TaxID=4796 RepID=A0A2P4X314_9STRA|nr:Secreted RxLR effector peptide protein [Phytophthora palmivora]